MSGCDGWITLKILELVLAIFCIIFKRVTDDEANKLFFFLQKYSREWPLLNNITWEENGAIFTDVTYGGFVIIIVGLIIAQCSGELQRCRKTENFFLILGALMFIGAGSLELAALDSVEERLVDNAAILGVISLLTGFVFILDLLLAGKRRKKYRTTVRRNLAPKSTQTEDTKIMEVYGSDMNGNLRNGGLYHSEMNGRKIPRNGVKILPSSPLLDLNSEPYAAAPPVYTPTDLKTSEGKIKSTESFLRSEKGEYLRRYRKEQPPDQLFIPPGYALVPMDHLEGKGEEEKRGSVTPPGYASIISDLKNRSLRTPPGYVMIPIDQIDPKNDDASRKIQTASDTTSVKSRNAHYPEDDAARTPHSLTNLSLSDLSDVEDARRRPASLKKYQPEFLQNAGRRPDQDRSTFGDGYRPDSRLSHKSLQDFRYANRGRLNQGYEDEFGVPPFRRNGSSQSSRMSLSDKPKSILRFDRIRMSDRKDKEEDGKDSRYDSLDSRKIAEDLRHLKEITKSDLDLTRDLENENEILKRRLRREKEESEKLKKQLDQDSRNYSQRKNLEERINELEDKERLKELEKKVRDLESRKMKELENEKDRRMSEHYFGALDLKQSHRDSSPVRKLKLVDIEQDMRRREGAGVKKVNEKLKEKFYEQEDKVKEDQELRKAIDDGFYFLDEEEKRRKNGRRAKGKDPGSPKRKPTTSKTPSPEESESPVSQATDEEIRLRIETPGSSSYKSEAQVWLGSDGELQTKGSSPPSTSPSSPGYVLRTAQNWPDTPSPSPQDRFRFSAKAAQKLKIGPISKTPSPETAGDDDDDDEDQKSFKSQKGLITRRVDFTEVPIAELTRSPTVVGSTSTWKKWLTPKTKFHHTKSAPS